MLLWYSIHANAQGGAFQSATDQETHQEIQRITHILNHPDVLDSLVKKAVGHSPTLKAFDHDMALYEEEYLQKKRNWISSFRMGLNVFSTNTVAYENQSVTTTGVLQNFGVTLTIDPEKFVNRKSYMRQATQKLQRSSQQQKSQELTLKVYITNQYFDYLELLESILMKQQILETREQHYLTSEVAFKNGNIEYNNLMIVQNSVQLAQQDLIKAQIQSQKKLNEIEIILGVK